MHKSSFKNMEKFALKYLNNLDKEKLRIIDIGSQDINGSYRPIFEKYQWQYYGCDMSEGKNVDIILNDVYNWKELKSESFDVVVSGQAFEHIEYFWITMLEISRILKEGGICCIIAPSGGFEHRYPIDCWRFYPDGMRALAKYAELEVLEVYTQWDEVNFPDYDPIWKDTVLICQKPKKQARKSQFCQDFKLSKLMKNNVIILGNLKDCKRALQKININLIGSLTFATNEKDIDNDWYSDKNKILVKNIKELNYDLIFIATQMVYEFMELYEQLINLDVESEKIWYNFDIKDFNLRLNGFTNYNSGTLKYKHDFFMKKHPTTHELETNLDFDSMNKLERYFYGNTGKPIFKCLHYFEIYDRHFSRFIGKDITVLEIGVSKGGSLELWRHYFGNKCKIYGIDINPECKKLESEQIEIIIGNAEDREFLRRVKEKISKIDILIDDGGHTMNQQITAFEELYPIISANGIYLCEDLVTSYWEEYGGGYKRENTFIEYSKNLIDYLNDWHSREKELNVDEFTLSTHSMHYYDAVLVIEKRKMNPPSAAMIGKLS